MVSRFDTLSFAWNLDSPRVPRRSRSYKKGRFPLGVWRRFGCWSLGACICSRATPALRRHREAFAVGRGVFLRLAVSASVSLNGARRLGKSSRVPSACTERRETLLSVRKRARSAAVERRLTFDRGGFGSWTFSYAIRSARVPSRALRGGARRRSKGEEEFLGKTSNHFAQPHHTSVLWRLHRIGKKQ